MMINRRNILLGAAATGICVALPASATQFLGGPAFGSTWRVMMPTSIVAPKVDRAITAVVAEIDALMSPWQSGSEISRFNSNRSLNWISLSPQITTVLAESRVVADLTNGAFEPGVGPLVNRYGFGPIIGEPGTLAGLELRKNAARKMSPDLTLDLCGIAKGYALDRMVGALDELGLDSYLIELGGEVRARGRHPDARDWNVGIERPGKQLTFQRIIAPQKLALATSGTFQNGYRDNSRLINHLIDPGLSKPVDNNIASVSVLAATAMRADALATALMVLGPKTGSEFAKHHGIDALFVLGQGPNFSEIITGDFADHILA
jgi:thiamine biosynthesis lipoprotein